MAFIPHTDDDITRMLEVIGVPSIDDTALMSAADYANYLAEEAK